MNLKKQKNRLGFTIVEVVVALGIFSIATTYAIDIFVKSNQVQKRTANIQRIMSDARYVLEVMAREVRMGHIDYAYTGYVKQAGVLNLEQAELAVRDIDDQPIRFRRKFLDGGGVMPDRYVIQVCQGDEVCLEADWLDITPEDLSVEKLSFYISPGKDPFVWDAVQADYPYDQQPIVTIVFETKSIIAELTSAKITNFQTTVTARKYIR